MTQRQDQIVRAMDEEGTFRVLTCDVTETVKATLLSQHAQGAEIRPFAELITATILFRETMSPDLRVQGITAASNGSGMLVADSHPSGDVRGLVQRNSGAAEVTLSPRSTLRMMRTMPSGAVNQGVVELGTPPTIAEGFMAYMQTSEQVVTMVGLGLHANAAGEVERAAGYLVQLLPGHKKGPLMVMTERLRDFENIDVLIAKPEFTAGYLLDELLYAMPHTRTAESQVRFHCWCDELKLIAALSTLPKSDLEDLASSAEALHINCDYCQKLYEIAPNRLKGLLDQS